MMPWTEAAITERLPGRASADITDGIPVLTVEENSGLLRWTWTTSSRKVGAVGTPWIICNTSVLTAIVLRETALTIRDGIWKEEGKNCGIEISGIQIFLMKSAGIGIKADCCKGREKMGSGVKKELLQLLREDEDVRKVLKDIIRKEAGDDRTQNGRAMTYSREVMKHDFEADSLPDKKDEGIGDMVRKLKNVIDTLKGRNRELNESIQSAMEGEANTREELRSMSLRAQQLENTVSALKERNEVLAQEAGQYKAAVNKLHEDIQSLRKDLEVQPCTGK